MTEKLGTIEVKLSRKMINSAGSKYKALFTQIIFDVHQVARKTRTNIGERFALVYGTGKNLGTIRIFFNREEGFKLIKPIGNAAANGIRFATWQTSETSDLSFTETHKQDISTEKMQAELVQADINTYLEVYIPLACYDPVSLEKLIRNKLTPVKGAEGWYLQAPRARGRTASQPQSTAKRGTTPSIPAPSVATAAEKVLAKTANSITIGSYFILPLSSPDEQLYVRKSVVNINAFKVVRNRPIIRLEDGQEIEVPMSPQEFITAIGE